MPEVGQDNLFAKDMAPAPYTTYRIVTTYLRKNGVLQMPVAGLAQDGSQSAEIVRVSSPYGGKMVQWIAEREGLPPVLPDPESDDANQVLESWRIIPQSPELMTNGAIH